MIKTLVDDIDDQLPQTQCGLCGYGGCRPYAEAMVKGEKINLCPPGGVETLHSLASLLRQDATPFLEDMKHKTKVPTRVVIRESECIGCTKCIQACPVDAIVGSAKLMHTVLSTECTGCELCISPCPVDCIDIITLPPQNAESKKLNADKARQRFQFRQQRLLQKKHMRQLKHQQAKNSSAQQEEIIAKRKLVIQEALLRVQNKIRN